MSKTSIHFNYQLTHCLPLCIGYHKDDMLDKEHLALKKKSKPGIIIWEKASFPKEFRKYSLSVIIENA